MSEQPFSDTNYALLRDLAHDLRVPIAGVQLALSTLLENMPAIEPEDLRCQLLSASESLAYLGAQVDNLFEFSRMRTPGDPSRRDVFDITELLGIVLDRLKLLVGDRRLSVVTTESPLLVEGDQSQIESLIQNLLANATRFSNAVIIVTSRRELGFIRITVGDDGPGLPDAGQTLFKPYVRGGRASCGRSTGLGLAICREIIESHRGAIGCCNRPEGGAEFWFMLPEFTLAASDEPTPEASVKPLIERPHTAVNTVS